MQKIGTTKKELYELIDAPLDLLESLRIDPYSVYSFVDNRNETYYLMNEKIFDIMQESFEGNKEIIVAEFEQRKADPNPDNWDWETLDDFDVE